MTTNYKTVKDLVSHLLTLDQDTEIRMYSEQRDCFFRIFAVKETEDEGQRIVALFDSQ